MSNNAINPAQGGFSRGESDLSSISKQYSSQDMPSHTKLKHRERGQNNSADMEHRDLRQELEDRERRAMESSSKKRKAAPDTQLMLLAKLDVDDPLEESSDSESDSSDEETAELYAELTRIKKERAIEEQQEAAKRKEEEEMVRRENILRGNPLFKINDDAQQEESEFNVKRRWNDDVVFKNCAKATGNEKKTPTFINDSLRSNFHRRFMDKYIK